MLEILSLLNTISPLGLAGLLALVLYQMAGHAKRLDVIRENDMHELSEILREVKGILIRMEERQIAAIAVMTERLPARA